MSKTIQVMNMCIKNRMKEGVSYKQAKSIAVFVTWLLVFLFFSMLTIAMVLGYKYYGLVPVVTVLSVFLTMTVSNGINARRYQEFKLTTEALLKQDVLLLETIQHVITANKHNSEAIKHINTILRKLASSPIKNTETIH